MVVLSVSDTGSGVCLVWAGVSVCDGAGDGDETWMMSERASGGDVSLVMVSMSMSAAGCKKTMPSKARALEHVIC